MKLFKFLSCLGLVVCGTALAHTNHQHHHHEHHTAHQQHHGVHTPQESATDLVFSQCWGRFREGQASALYVDIKNNDTHQAAYIVGLKSTDFAETMLHESYVNAEGISGMRHIEAIKVEAAQSFSLKPGGYHAMLMQPKQVKVGDQLDFAFVLSNGHEITTQCVMKSIRARSYQD